MEESKKDAMSLRGEDEQGTLDRKEFFKTVGIGLGAVALGAVTGAEASVVPEGPTEMAPVVGGRAGIQRLVRYLVEHPEKAGEFLMHPISVTQELGIVVEASEMDVIRNAIEELGKGKQGEFLIAKDTKPKPLPPPKHADFKECEHVNAAKPTSKSKTKPKPKTKTKPKPQTE